MADEEQRNQRELDFTGYRFHPTDEEIVSYFLARKLSGSDINSPYIKEIDIHEFEPWELPTMADMHSDSEWYFFNKPTYMKHNSKKVNRRTKAGFWKITGKDRQVKSKNGAEIGSKKTLVFHRGHFPNGVRTPWVIQEFHYKDANIKFERHFVLCRLKKKSGDGEEPSPPPLASNSGNCLNGNIVPQENNEIPSDLLPFLDNNEPDNSSSVQIPMPIAEGPSCSNRSINVLDVERSQLDTREQDDDFSNSILILREQDADLNEENEQTRLPEQTRLRDLTCLAGCSRRTSRSSVQIPMPIAEGPSCSNRSINVLDVERSQLDTREQDDDFINSSLTSRKMRGAVNPKYRRTSRHLRVFSVFFRFFSSFGNCGRNKKK